MDIVIPYKANQHNGTELKFALRSIEKYLTGYRGVWIIGDLPKGINTDKVFYIQASHDPNRKEWDICSKILKACELPVISENFIMWHDDHLLLKPLDVSEIKAWHNGPLENELKRTRSAYKQAVENTLKIFQWAEPLNFDIHVPCIFNKHDFQRINTPAEWKNELCLKSLYFNCGSEAEYMDDLKINQTGLSKEKIYSAIKDRLFFSTGPLAMEYHMTEVLKELYPEPSKYGC